MNDKRTTIGATLLGEMTEFRVWSPETRTVELVLSNGSAQTLSFAMMRDADGYWCVQTLAPAGTLYAYMVDGRGPFPDPASRFQPRGVHGPSAVVDPSSYRWSDQQWSGITLKQAVFYELHIGAFTPEGTFAAAARKLDYLAGLGVTAVELMPVSDFAGNRNWGYDGVALFAPARCYGTPDDMRAFVDQAHASGLAVFLDVVYNHFGPDGAYQGTFSADYYSKLHRSLWGDGINVDGPRSEPVREYFAENALRWIHEYHIDGLRLDATHAIVDNSPEHLLTFISRRVKQSLANNPRRVHLIAEDHSNLAAMVKPVRQQGWGLDGVWSDDFHHQMRRALAGDRDGYFQDFEGTSESIAETARRGWYYSGQYAPYFGGVRGTDPTGIPYEQFVFFLQNHDQIGNRAFGDRLHHSIDPAAYRAASAFLLLLPEAPLLFMGQEWAASTPFQFFTDHHEELGKLVTAGRRSEFSRFQSFASPEEQSRIPDPQALSTFEASRLNWEECHQEPHGSVLQLYRRLLALRRSEPALQASRLSPELQIEPYDSQVLVLRRESGSHQILAVFRLAGEGTVDLRETTLAARSPGERWELILTTEDPGCAPDSAPPSVDLPRITFARPGAVVLRSVRPEVS